MSGSKHRAPIEIVADILAAAVRPDLPTHIMYRSNLSWNPLRKYLRQLQEKGLIEKVNKRYKTTEKGLEFLRGWQQALEKVR